MLNEKSQASPAPGQVADIESLLPWYINGSLDTARCREVEQWLLQCDQTRTRLQAWQCIAQNTSNLTRECASRSADERGAWSSIETALNKNPKQRNGQPPKHAKAGLFISLGAVAFVLALLVAFLLGAIQ